MTILIIGSEGFIGANAVRYFRNKRYEVWTADIVAKEEDRYIAIDPVRADFLSLFSVATFDVCLNASGAANVQFSFEQPGTDYLLNAANVYFMLDAIRQRNPSCKFINLSSAAVYGNPDECPVKESATPKPVSPYGFHKLHSEQMCREFHSFYHIPAISLRIFSAFGEGLKKQLFWDLFQKVKKSQGNSIELFGTGNETRDFIYIQDIVKAIDCVIEKGDFNGRTVNLASGRETTIAEATTVFLQCMSSSLKIEFTGNQKIGDPYRWRADIELLKSYGFSPQHSLEEGLKNYTRWLGEKAY